MYDVDDLIDQIRELESELGKVRSSTNNVSTGEYKGVKIFGITVDKVNNTCENGLVCVISQDYGVGNIPHAHVVENVTKPCVMTQYHLDLIKLNVSPSDIIALKSLEGS